MEVTSLIPTGGQIVEAYGGGGFRVGGEALTGSILVRPERPPLAWPVRRIEEITLAGLTALWAGENPPEVLLLGCGPRMAMPPGGLRRELREAGPVLEPMDTGAACRTYNVLLAEGRDVAAALIAID